jgi:hypothetical protein
MTEPEAQALENQSPAAPAAEILGVQDELGE